MNTISPEQLLSQIRAMGQGLQTPQPPTINTPESKGADFGQLLKTSLDSVNDAQMASREMKLDFEKNPSSQSLAQVMIASQKADLSFRAVTEVRNKLVTAYQDIMNMPV